MRVMLTALFALAVAYSAPALAAPEEPRGPLPPVAQAQGDRNQNRIDDAFEERLGRAGAAEQFNVMVSMAPGQGVAAARSATGPFTVRRSFTLINGFAATMTRAQIEALSRAPGTLRIQEDRVVTVNLQDAVNAFGAARVHAGEAPLPAAYDGTGEGICVVDTGIDYDHADLVDPVSHISKVVGFCNVLATNGCPTANNDPGDPTLAFDDHGHGTHVAAISAGNVGVARGSRLYGAKVMNSNGSGTESDIIAGIEYCVRQDAVHVINQSLGSSGSSDGSDLWSLASEAAVDAGKVVVVAAGNSGPGQYSVSAPAAAEKLISVAAVSDWLTPSLVTTSPYGTPAKVGKGLVPFSSRGPTADDRIKPDIAAPGVDILAAKANTAADRVAFSGTSMASPFAAGTVALMLQANPALTPSQVKNLLADSAVHRGDPASLDPQGRPKNIDFGWGELDVYGAVAAAANVTGDAAYQPTAFPTAISQRPLIHDNQEWVFSFNVDDTNNDQQISVNVFNDGYGCSYYVPGFGCLIGIEAADFDAELYAPGGGQYGTMVDSSTCEYDLDTYCGSSSRQETLLADPQDFGGTLPSGQWTVRVYPWNGDAADDKPSERADVVITMGPLVGAATGGGGGGGGGGGSNAAPVAAFDWTPASPTTIDTVVLNGGLSNDPDDDPLTYAWTIDSWPGGRRNQPALSDANAELATFDPAKAGDYVVTLTVSDGVASDSVTHTITVQDGGGSSGGGKSCNPKKPSCTSG